MNYQITFSRSARKELQKLEENLLHKIFSKIQMLGDNPKPSGCRKLQSYENLWRIRIGDYRVLYSIEENEKIIDIVAVRHRKEAYK
jgi:mRNA interferase RelE/StbE